MGAAYCELTIEQGADWYLNLWIRNDDGSPKDLTGYQVDMMARQTVQGDVEISMTSGGGTPNVVITPSEGKIAGHLTFAETVLLAFMEGVYDLFLTYTTPTPDTKTKLIYGPVHVRPAVTR